MRREDLVRLCAPLSPEVALATLQEFYDDLAGLPDGVTEEELEALNGGIEVLKACIQETAGST